MTFTVSVPNVAGVPAVLRAATTVNALTLLTSDSVLAFAGALIGVPWGIYLGILPVVSADNVVSFGYRQQWAVADFPIEDGGFQSYDKVSVPFQSRFRFTAGGSEANRLLFLESIQAIAGNTLLYNIVTPEKIYTNVTIDSFDYNRTAQSGVGLISVDVSTTEIRIGVATTTGITSPQDPGSTSAVNSGTVQTTQATGTQAAQAGSIASSGGRLAA